MGVILITYKPWDDPPSTLPQKLPRPDAHRWSILSEDNNSFESTFGFPVRSLKWSVAERTLEDNFLINYQGPP